MVKNKFEKLIKNPKLTFPFLRTKFFNLFFAKNIIQKNIELKNIHKDEKCFVIGNGPSLNKQDLTLLQDEFTFVMNEFYLHKDFQIISPNYYCLIDDYYFKKENLFSLKEIEKVTFPNKKITFFFPALFKKSIREHHLFENNKKYYLAFKGRIINTYPKVYLDITKPISGGNFTSYACLFLARYMGFKKIYLVGFDHDWVTENGKEIGCHFYDQIREAEDIPQEKLIYFSDQYKIRESYSIIKDLFLKGGVEIFNATKGGYLDVFKRIDYNSLFKNEK